MATGTVKWFSAQRGYGFIETPEEDLFVHYSEIQMEGFKKLRAGQKVECEVGEARAEGKPRQALNVRVVT